MSLHFFPYSVILLSLILLSELKYLYKSILRCYIDSSERKRKQKFSLRVSESEVPRQLLGEGPIPTCGARRPRMLRVRWSLCV